ncbi:uncharacterized protein isoform X1 [Leptinotarsa decemlineata]|uniref:uncharacterized protein isoform X1 n=1 Tax=Leptinotarsa decemlineata TaxID=7539 RepID=UPI003D308DEE
MAANDCGRIIKRELESLEDEVVFERNIMKCETSETEMVGESGKYDMFGSEMVTHYLEENCDIDQIKSENVIDVYHEPKSEKYGDEISEGPQNKFLDIIQDAGSWSTSRKRASTPPAAALKTPRASSPELVILSPFVTRLPPLPATPADPEVLMPQVVREPIGEVSEKLSVFLQRCKEAERASRSSEAALVTMNRQMAEMDNRRRELQKEMAEIDRNYASLQERCKAETSSIELYKKLVTIMDTIFVDKV